MVEDKVEVEFWRGLETQTGTRRTREHLSPGEESLGEDDREKGERDGEMKRMREDKSEQERGRERRREGETEELARGRREGPQQGISGHLTFSGQVESSPAPLFRLGAEASCRGASRWIYSEDRSHIIFALRWGRLSHRTSALPRVQVRVTAKGTVRGNGGCRRRMMMMLMLMMEEEN